MDPYITILTGSLETYENAVRMTGRTEYIMDRLEPGDLFVVHSREMEQTIKRQLQHQTGLNKDITVKYINPKTVDLSSIKSNSYSRIFFDNCWLYLYYQQKLKIWNMNWMDYFRSIKESHNVYYLIFRSNNQSA